jgi:hypothetical protein
MISEETEELRSKPKFPGFISSCFEEGIFTEDEYKDAIVAGPNVKCRKL